jgi:hypothetical protein
MSNVHLRTDAEERVTMANTYLSFLRNEADALNEDSRRLILDALFRSSATGIVKDDGMPPTAIDAIARLFSGRG